MSYWDWYKLLHRLGDSDVSSRPEHPKGNPAARETFKNEVDSHVHAFMIWNQAGFHVSQKVKVPGNVTIIPLPPYSPQLNPIEKLWQYLRQHHWSNRVYEGYDPLRQAASQVWHKVGLNPEKIKSICRAKYVEYAFYLGGLV